MLYPTVSMSMQGRLISSWSRIWTVFSSKIRAPPSHDSTMFWASWLCGPAAGPMGVAATRPMKSTDRSGPFDTSKNRAVGMSKMRLRELHSRAIRSRRALNGNGVSGAAASVIVLPSQLGVQPGGLLASLGAYLVGIDPGRLAVGEHDLTVDLDFHRVHTGGECQMPWIHRIV